MSRTLPRPILGRGNSLARMVVVIGKAFEETPPAGGASGKEGRGGDSLLRQRNELMLLRNRRKTSGFPVLFRLLDALLAGGDEIPPDVPRAFQCIAAQEHHARRLDRLYRDAVAGPEDQEFWALVALACDLDLAVDEIDRALLVIGIERH